MKLKTFSVNDIRRLRPCYDPVTGLSEEGNVVHPGGFVSEDWTGTAIDVLKIAACPVEDRFWVVFHEGWIDDRTLRLFAVWCTRGAQKLVDNPDPHSIAACDVAERYALGAATDQELTAARSAAWAAARSAATDQELTAARAAAWATAEATAGDAARAAARSAWAAAWATAEASASASAWAAARDAQIKRLIAMLEADEDLGR